MMPIMGRMLSDSALRGAVTAALGGRFPYAGAVTVVARRPNALSSTFESEVVTCRLVDGTGLNIFCKYEQFVHPTTTDHGSWGHRRGNRYEADVYRRVLESLPGVAPRYFGVARDVANGPTCLLIEYLEGADYLEDVSELCQAATWLARFHRNAERIASQAQAAFLTRYDLEYYTGWARRTAEFAEPFHNHVPWLRGICERFADDAAAVLQSQPTIVHGECYRKNVLVHEGNIRAVDWESCAVGAAEVDLAMLSDGWATDVMTAIKEHYVRERWPAGAPQNFAQRLAMATVYMHLRWLGDRADRTRRNLSSRRFRDLRDIAETFGWPV